MESDKISVAAPGEYDSIEAALNGAKALPNEAGDYWKRKGGGEKDVYHYYKCDLHVNCTRMLTIRKLPGNQWRLLLHQCPSSSWDMDCQDAQG